MTISIDVVDSNQGYLIPDKTRPDYSIDTTITILTDDELSNPINSATVSYTGSDRIDFQINLPTIRFVGTIDDKFKDFFYYVEKGSSSYLDENGNFTPTSSAQVVPNVVEGVKNLPPNKDFFSVVQDRTDFVDIEFQVTVNGTENFTVKQKIYNEWEAIRSTVANYYS